MDDPTQKGVYPHATVGWAKAQANTTLQERLALLNAKANLAKMAQSDINTTLTLEQNQSASHLKVHSIHKSQGLIRLKILKRYRDKEGALFLWVVAP